MFHSTNRNGATRTKRLPIGVILPCSFSYSVPRDFCRRKEGALFTARTLILNDLSIETQTIERRVTPSNRVLYVTRDMYLCVSRFDRKLFSFSFWFLRPRIYSARSVWKTQPRRPTFVPGERKFTGILSSNFFYRFLRPSYAIACFQAARANRLGGIVANVCLCVYRVYVNACTVFNIFRGNVYKRRVLSNTRGSDISSRYTLKYRFRCTFVYTITQAPNAEINLSRHN